MYRLGVEIINFQNSRNDKESRKLEYTTAVYQHDTKTGKDVYVLDAGGYLSGMDVIWSELPFVEQEQIDKILGVLPF